MAELTEAQKQALIASAREAAVAQWQEANAVAKDARENLPWGYAGKPGRFRPDVRQPSRGEAAVRSGNNGLLLGWSPELVGAAQSALASVPYATARDAEIERLRLGRESYPGTTTAAEIAGGVGTGLALGYPAISPTAGTGVKMAVGAGMGGAEGAIYGAGEAGPGRRGPGAMYGGALGIGIGAGIPAATAAARTFIGNPVGATLGVGNAQRGRNAVVRTIDSSTRSMDDVSQYLDDAARSGQPAIAADALGEDARGLLAGAIRQPGPARNMGNEFLIDRQLGAPHRVQGFVEDAFDLRTPTGRALTAKGAKETVRQNRGNVFSRVSGDAAATAQPVDVRGTIAQLDDTISQMTNSGIVPTDVVKEFQAVRAQLAGMTPDGNPTTLSDYQSVLGVYRQVRDKIDEYFTSKSGKTAVAEALKPIRDSLNAQLEDASDLYRFAQDNYRQGSRVMEAIDAGEEMAGRVRPEDTNPTFLSMSPGEQRGAQIGYGNRIVRDVQNNRATASDYAREFRSGTRSQQADVMANNPDLLKSRMGVEDDMLQTFRRGTSGASAPTAELQASQSMANGQDIAMVANLATGNVTGAGRNVLDRVLNGLAGRNEKTREEIVRLLLAQDPSTLRQAYETAAGSGQAKNAIEAMLRNALRIPANEKFNTALAR